MRILLVRHASPDYTTDTLTAAGEREAAAVGRRLAQQGIDRLYCSPLGRARQTAHAIAAATGQRPMVEDWTAELNALRIDPMPHNVQMAWDLHGEIVRGEDRLPTRDDWHVLPEFCDRGLEQEIARVQRASDDWIASLGYEREGGRYRIRAGHQETICLAAHGGFGLTWLAHLLELPLPLVWAGFFLPCSSVTSILFDERSSRWAVPRVVGLGDVSHLHAEGLPVSTLGVKANSR